MQLATSTYIAILHTLRIVLTLMVAMPIFVLVIMFCLAIVLMSALALGETIGVRAATTLLPLIIGIMVITFLIFTPKMLRFLVVKSVKKLAEKYVILKSDVKKIGLQTAIIFLFSMIFLVTIASSIVSNMPDSDNYSSVWLRMLLFPSYLEMALVICFLAIFILAPLLFVFTQSAVSSYFQMTVPESMEKTRSLRLLSQTHTSQSIVGFLAGGVSLMTMFYVIDFLGLLSNLFMLIIVLMLLIGVPVLVFFVIRKHKPSFARAYLVGWFGAFIFFMIMAFLVGSSGEN